MSHFFTLGCGDPLFLEESGPGAGPALVCIHGLGGGGYFFAGLARFLESHHIVCPDLPGSGFSPRGDRAITFDRLADVIVELIERRTRGPVTLLGHSMGTIIALMAYARMPSRIDSMFFVGGLPAPLPEAQARLRDRAGVARKTGMLAVATTIVPVVFAPRSLDLIADKVAMFHRLLAASDVEGYAQAAMALADASAIDVVSSVRVPCFCVTGFHDRYAPPVAVREFAGTLRLASYQELPDCGHMPFFEDTDGFNGVVKDFLSNAR